MPIIRKFEEKNHYEDFEEINEHTPLFISNEIVEEFPFSEKEPQVNTNLWKRVLMFFKIKFPKI